MWFKVFKKFDDIPGRNDAGFHGWNFTLTYIGNVCEILLGTMEFHSIKRHFFFTSFFLIILAQSNFDLTLRQGVRIWNFEEKTKQKTLEKSFGCIFD